MPGRAPIKKKIKPCRDQDPGGAFCLYGCVAQLAERLAEDQEVVESTSTAATRSWSHRSVVRTVGCQPANRGSIPLDSAILSVGQSWNLGRPTGHERESPNWVWVTVGPVTGLKWGSGRSALCVGPGTRLHDSRRRSTDNIGIAQRGGAPDSYSGGHRFDPGSRYQITAGGRRVPTRSHKPWSSGFESGPATKLRCT